MNSTAGGLLFSNTVDLKAREVTFDVSGNITFAGVTRSSSGLLVKRGSGVLTLNGASDNVGLAALVEEGTLVLGKTSDSAVHSINGSVSVASGGMLKLAGTGGNQIPTGYTLSLAAGGFADFAGLNEDLDILEGFGIVTNSAAAQSLLTVGRNNTTFNFFGSIVDGAAGGKVAFTKIGGGTVKLMGNNSYSGDTTITSGTLIISTTGSGRGIYSIADSRTLGIEQASPDEAISIQNLTAGLDANLQFIVGAEGLPQVPVLNAKVITTSAGARIMLAGSINETGKFPIVTYTTYDGGFPLRSGSLPPGVTAFLSNDIPNKLLSINLTSILPLRWSGAANPSWNTANVNWLQSGSAVTYSQNSNGGHAVIFDDTLTTAANTNVLITITASPIRMDVNCTNKNYSFTGLGRISGSPRLTKNGPGKLRIATTNDYAGVTFINGGILEVANASALGSISRGTVVAPGATLQLSNLIVLPEPLTLTGAGSDSGGVLRNVAGTSVWSGPITLTGIGSRIENSIGSLRIAAPIAGPDASLTLAGAGEIILSNGVTATGLIKENSGIARLLGSNNLTGAIAVSHGTLDLKGTNTGSATIEIAGNGVLAGTGTHGGRVLVNGTISPGSSAGQLDTGPQVWNAGGAYIVDVVDAAGAPGTGWDLLNIDGGVDVAAGPGQFTVKLISSSDGAPGLAAGFNNNSTHRWPIVSLSGTATNLSAAVFAIDTSQFDNDLAGGTFLIETNEAIYVRFTNNHPPTAANPTFTRAAGTTMKIAISELLASFTADVDGDERELTVLGATANGGSVVREGNWLFYTPPMGDGDDSFSFTVRDVRNYRAGDTVRTSTAIIEIIKVRSAGAAQHINASGGVVSITFAGIPGFAYDVERSEDLENWSVLSTVVNPESGVFSFVDPEPPVTAAYYRLRQH